MCLIEIDLTDACEESIQQWHYVSSIERWNSMTLTLLRANAWPQWIVLIQFLLLNKKKLSKSFTLQFHLNFIIFFYFLIHFFDL